MTAQGIEKLCSTTQNNCLHFGKTQETKHEQSENTVRQEAGMLKYKHNDSLKGH